MPDVAAKTSNSHALTMNGGDSSTITADVASPPPPATGINVHQIASMFSSLQSQNSQQNRRSTIASLSENNISTKKHLFTSSSSNVRGVHDNKCRQHMNGSSGASTSHNKQQNVAGRFTRSRSTDARCSVTTQRDLHFLEEDHHRENFSSAKALFENLERASREQRRGGGGVGTGRRAMNGSGEEKKRNASMSPSRRFVATQVESSPTTFASSSSSAVTVLSSSTAVTVVETRSEVISIGGGELIKNAAAAASLRHHLTSPVGRSPPPPIPPKPKNLLSPSPTDAATKTGTSRFRKFSLDAEKEVENGGKQVENVESSEGFSSLERAAKEINDLVTSLELMTDAAIVDAETPKLANGEKKKEDFGAKAASNGGVDRADRASNVVAVGESLWKNNEHSYGAASAAGVKQSTSSAYEPYWRQPNYHQIGIRRPLGTSQESIVAEPSGRLLSSKTEEEKRQEIQAEKPREVPTATTLGQVQATTAREVQSATTREVVKAEIVQPSPSERLRAFNEEDSKDSGVGSEGLAPATSLDTIVAAAAAQDGKTSDDKNASTLRVEANGVEYMTPDEAAVLLSPATQAVLRRPPKGNQSTSGGGGSEIKSLPSHLAVPQDTDMKRLSMCSVDSSSNDHVLSTERLSMVDDTQVHWLPDGQFYVEIEGVPFDADEAEAALPSVSVSNGDVVIDYKKPTKVTFNNKTIRVYSTYSPSEYDRRNDDIDPVSASAEYELERRLEKMDILDIELDKGSEGLGFSIIGMGVGADNGLEKLGIFVKSITPGGAVYRDGRICICDQIVEVDGKNLVGVSQTYAATVLRGTTGHVKFKIGREQDLNKSEIAQLIRQSLEADQAAIAREQKLLAERLNLSMDDYSSNGTREPLPSSDSVFEEETPDDEQEEETPRIDELMTQLKKPKEEANWNKKVSTDGVDDTGRRFDSQAKTSSAFEIKPDPHANVVQDGYAEKELNRLLLDEHDFNNGAIDESLDDEDTSTATVVPRHTATKENARECEDEEHELINRIGSLEETLNDVKKEAGTYQHLLVNSQGHYSELEKRYEVAKRKIKDYQEREKDLLDREEAHMKELREKDALYSNLVKRLNDKVAELEKQLNDAQRKRASLAESASVNSMNAATIANGTSTSIGVAAPSTSSTTDLSPALAYLPMKKSSPSTPTGTSLAMRLSTDDAQASSSTSEHRTTINVGVDDDIAFADDDQHDFGVPCTQLLDSTAAKSKADAVKQSIIMCARNLPSRHSDAEVYVTCHHTIEHAQMLKSHPSQVITESTSNNNTTSPSKSSSSAASTNSTGGGGGSPLSSRRLLDLINFRKKAVAASAAVAAYNNKDLEASVRGGLDKSDFEKVPEVLQWTCEDVFRFLNSLGLAKYEPEFRINRIDGSKLLQLDGAKLKSMGVTNHNDRAIIKKRVKDMKVQIEKERKRENKKLVQKVDRKLSRH